MNLADREMSIMREMLAAHGIVLDEPRNPIADRDVKPSNIAPVDRAAIRAALVAAGAPADELDWLADSCPSIDKARAYRPACIAWCPRCDGPTICGADGCMSCHQIGGAP